jgi:hypothetical protein
MGTLRYIWAGDFNRHHPLWDELRNQHLFTTENLAYAQPLLDLLARHRMAMALPRDIPTLRAFRTKNHTRLDNVFCSTSLLPLYITCTTDPERMPPKTDHFPVIQVLELDHTASEHVPTPLYKKADWEEYRNRLLEALVPLDHPERYETVESVTVISRLSGLAWNLANVGIPVHYQVRCTSPGLT